MLIDQSRREGQQVKILLDPKPYAPRKNKRKQTRLMTEFAMRSGDPNMGGVTRTKIITAYRQDALRCAAALNGGEEMKVAEIRTTSGVPRTASILQKNHYGWFERTGRGVYRLSPLGAESLKLYADVLSGLNAD